MSKVMLALPHLRLLASHRILSIVSTVMHLRILQHPFFSIRPHALLNYNI
jgi:hypothetical protein